MFSLKKLETILDNAPEGWYGTTYPNDSRFVGPGVFKSEIQKMLNDDEKKVDVERLEQLYPEDYVRLGSPFSNILELVLAKRANVPFENAFAFGSRTLPLISVLLVAKEEKVTVWYESEKGKKGSILTSRQKQMLSELYGCEYMETFGETYDDDDDSTLVIRVVEDLREENAHKDTKFDAKIDRNGMLYVLNTTKIPLQDIKDGKGKMITEGIHTIRKRLGGPPPTPDSIRRLRNIVNGNDDEGEVAPDVDELKQHLKTLAGCSNANGDVLISTVGLSSLAACVMAALEFGNKDIDVVMCSTAYGGSCQQTDILIERTTRSKNVRLEKHKFDIQGNVPVFDALQARLGIMRKRSKQKKLTIVEIEYPTNPDMKDCDLKKLKNELISYRKDTGSEVVLILDTTFSPPSAAAQGFGNDIPVLVWTSLSKSVSGGLTTAGSLCANSTKISQELLRRSHDHLALFDTYVHNFSLSLSLSTTPFYPCLASFLITHKTAFSLIGPQIKSNTHTQHRYAKPCQLSLLNKMHKECEKRVELAHENAKQGATYLENTVKYFSSGKIMRVNFVTQDQIRKIVRPATFSFNLPKPEKCENAASLAQDFVDELVSRCKDGVKPCVSFGQVTKYVYVTVPATSTQGVISEEDKAKQAVGGVQLVRFSFPPKMDMAAWKYAVRETVRRLYTGELERDADKKRSICSSGRKWNNSIGYGVLGVSLALVAGLTYFYFNRRSSSRRLTARRS